MASSPYKFTTSAEVDAFQSAISQLTASERDYLFEYWRTHTFDVRADLSPQFIARIKGGVQAGLSKARAEEGPIREGGREADAFWKGFVSFWSGINIGWAASGFIGEVGTRIAARASGFVAGQGSAQLTKITLWLGVASAAPEGPIGWGMLIGTALRVVPALRELPSPGEIVGEVYEAAKPYLPEQLKTDVTAIAEYRAVARSLAKLGFHIDPLDAARWALVGGPPALVSTQLPAVGNPGQGFFPSQIPSAPAPVAPQWPVYMGPDGNGYNVVFSP